MTSIAATAPVLGAPFESDSRTRSVREAIQASTPWEASKPEFRELACLASEPDDPIYWESVLALGARIGQRGDLKLASAIFVAVAENCGIEACRKRAEAEISLLRGEGSFGARAEKLLGEFVSSATDFRVIAPMMGASMISAWVGAGSLGALSKWSGAWYSRGSGAKSLSGLLAFATEVLSFPALARAMSPGEGGPFGQDLQRSAISLGFLRAFSLAGHAGAGSLFSGFGAAVGNPRARGLGSAIPQLGMFLGLYCAHAAEAKLGLRPVLARESAVFESLSSLVSLGVGSRLGRRILGPNFVAMQEALRLRASQTSPRHALPGEFMGGAAPAVAGAAVGGSRLSIEGGSPMGPHVMMMSSDPRMERSYGLAGALVKEKMDAGSRRALDEVKEGEIVVVEGEYDKIERVLEGLGVPYRFVAPSQIQERMLHGAMGVFVNCCNQFPTSRADLLGEWVASGGFMMSTDWALMRVVERAFRLPNGDPLYVKYNGTSTGGARQPGENHEQVEVSEFKAGEPWTQGFLNAKRPRWWLEPGSMPIRILAKDRVEVLARSAELGRRYGEDPVIVRFPHGKGGVVHMISHFYLQHGGARPGVRDGDALDYATQIGASQELRERVRRSGGAEGVTESTLISATTSLSVVAGTLTQIAGRRSRGGEARESAARRQGSVEIQGGSQDGLVWRPEGAVWSWGERPGRPAAWTLRMPRDREVIEIGRLGEARIYDLRSAPKISRRHARIERMSPGDGRQFSIVALDGAVAVHSADGKASISLAPNRGGVGGRSWVGPGDRVGLSEGVEFYFDAD